MSALAEPRKLLFTVDDYYRMAETGILRPDERVELIEGEIIAMTPMGSRHAAVIAKLDKALQKLSDRASVFVQSPIRVSWQSEPEPEVMLLVFRDNFYKDAHPTPKDVLLLIEVAETSLSFDRTIKIPLYARHGVQEAWLVDLKAESVEVYRSPSESGYQEVRVFRGEDEIAPMAFPDFRLHVHAILG